MTLNAQVSLVSAPDTVNQGAPFTVRFHVENTGTEPFDPARYKLGFQHPQDNAMWGADRIFLPEVIPAHGALEFDAPLVCAVPGKHQLSVQMLREGYAWFGNATPLKQIVVLPTPPPQKPMSPPRSDPNDLLGQYVVNTGPFAADGTVMKYYWQNTSGRTILIVQAGLWLGCDGGLVCDADADLVREADGSLVAAMPTDHYAEGPAGANRQLFDFAPHYIALQPDERLVLLCWGNDYKGGKGNVHFAAYIWWRYRV